MEFQHVLHKTSCKMIVSRLKLHNSDTVAMKILEEKDNFFLAYAKYYQLQLEEGIQEHLCSSTPQKT